MLPLYLLLSGCGSTHSRTTADTKLLWQSGLNYVRIEPQAAGRGRALANDHPVQFTADQIHGMLAALEVKAHSSLLNLRRGEEPEYEPVFLDKELKKIDSVIAEALATATPYQDVTVSTTALRSTKFADFINESKTTAARIFYRDRRLNIIFSEMHVAYQKKIMKSGQTNPKAPTYVDAIEAHRNQPNAGRRVTRAKVDWEFKPEPWLYYANIGGRQRTDWVLIDPAPAIAAADERKLREQGNEKLGAEQVELRQKVEQLEQEVRTGRPPVFSPPPAVVAPAGAGGVEARLARLKELYERGVITRELYLDRAGALLEAY